MVGSGWKQPQRLIFASDEKQTFGDARTNVVQRKQKTISGTCNNVVGEHCRIYTILMRVEQCAR